VQSNDQKYCLTDKKMEYDLDVIKKEAEKLAPDSLAAYNMLKLMADNYPDYLAGKKTGVDIIFSTDNIETTNSYYSNNLYYNVHNIAGAKILNFDIENRENPRILEIGGGVGGGTKQFLLQRLKEKKSLKDFSYEFTDIANKMLRATKRDLLTITDDIGAFSFGKLDFNLDLTAQEYGENSYDVVWGVNAIHVAKDLKFTLKELLKILKPGGSLIISETVRSKGNRMIQQEFLLNTLNDYWNVKLDKDIRPRHGFMEWYDWTNAFKAIGFTSVETVPDMSVLEKKYDNCYIAVIRGIK
jgi:SAM-dependent methyltransferase